ncbi:MAG: hypothetical protein KF824_06065 [Fimbriimonadaceae bacterium]|nr:MAG: hypothetical protein KF824_06065 [Fimbriimonadaceae bacterium]
MSKRFFNEKEAAELVLKAAKLQEQSNEGSSSYAPGISYDELARMAAEAGVDPSFLQKALESAPEKNESPVAFLGIPLSTEFERIVDGELPPENFDVITDIFPAKFAGHGPRGPRMHNVGVQVGRSMQMQLAKGSAFGTLRVTSRNGRTRISTRQGMFLPFMAGLYPGLMGAVLALAFLTDRDTKAFANPAINIPLAIASLIVGLVAFVLLARSGQNKMREMTDAIAERVQEETDLMRDRLGETSDKSLAEDEELREHLRE